MLDDLLATLRVISLPTRTNFRGVTYREVALMQGPQGWGEYYSGLIEALEVVLDC